MKDLVFYRLQEEHYFQGTQKLTSYFEYSGTEEMVKDVKVYYGMRNNKN